MTSHNYDSGMFKTGDLVIGSSDPSKSVYKATGARVNSSGVSIYGSPEDLLEKEKELTASLVRNGGKKIASSPTKGAKKKETKKAKSWPPCNNYMTAEYREESAPVVAQEEKSVSVQFENSFGKMKAKVLSLVEHEQAFMLVFKNEDSVVFEPKIGETLSLYNQYKERYDVYYPGVTFDWPDSEKKLMILFKVPEENQE